MIRYIYATADVEVPYLLKKSEREDAWSSKSNWIGYVAVCTDEREIKRLGRRDILIVWRGTVTGLEWAANLKFNLIPCGLTDEIKHGLTTPIEVEQGFLSLYTSKREDSLFNKVSAQTYLAKEIQDLIDKYRDQHELSITVTGHSLGSALAILSAYDIAESDLNRIVPADGDNKNSETLIPITVFSFAGPRVGNKAFKDRLADLGVKVLRVVNKADVVPHVPGWHVLENVLRSAYTHVGVKLELNDEDSKHLNHDKAEVWNFKNMFDLSHDFSALALHHNLEVYLHLIDGYGRYDMPPSRDPILVNKSCGYLKDDKFVAEAWWQPKHKGLQYSIRENRYYQPDRAVDDIPVPPTPETVEAAKAFTRQLTLRKSLERNKSRGEGKRPTEIKAEIQADKGNSQTEIKTTINSQAEIKGKKP